MDHALNTYLGIMHRVPLLNGDAEQALEMFDCEYSMLTEGFS